MVVLQNTTGPSGPGEVASAIVDLLRPEAPTPAATDFPGDLNALAGMYQGPSRGRPMRVEVSVREGVLNAAMNGSEATQAMMPIGDGIFVPEDDPWGPRVWFVDGEGRVVGTRGGGDPVQLRFDGGGGHYVLFRQPGG